MLTEAAAAGDVRTQAEALTQLGAAEVAVGAYDAADETLGEALERWREVGDDAGGADVLRELGVAQLFRGDLVQAERYVSEALAVVPVVGTRARRGVGAAEPRVDRVHARRHSARRGTPAAVGERVRASSATGAG